MLGFYLLFGILYALLIRYLGGKWEGNKSPEKKTQLPGMVSVVVPYRNEEENLGPFLDKLLQLSYRPLELILVNDHSNDRSESIVGDFRYRFLEMEIDFRNINSEGIGKKAALSKAIGISRGKFVMTTDADCWVPIQWVERLIDPFSNDEIQLSCGPVMSFGGQGFFHRFQQIEWASILLLTRFGFVQGRPIMCSAANMAFRKEAFLAVNGYQGNAHVPTGDDEFLLKKIVARFGAGSVAYSTSAELLVMTRSQKSVLDLIQQRIRWASKWRMHKSLAHILSATIPALVQLLWISSFALISRGLPGGYFLAVIWTLKVFFEKRSFQKVLSGYSIAVSWIDYFLTSLLHPIYVTAIAWGTLFSNYSWKGRKYSGKP